MRDSTRRDSTRFFLLGSILAPPGSRRVRTLRSPCVLSSLTTTDHQSAKATAVNASKYLPPLS